jgi:WD40 repeat protein
MNFYFILLAITFALPNFGMELPQDQVPQNRVPSLVELAARKCSTVVEPFDPNKGYVRALKNLDSRAITHVVGKKLAPLLARSNAQVLQSILDDETQPTLFRSSYSNPHQNLYEDNHGIYEYSGSFCNPPIRQLPDTKYRTVTLSDDKVMCAKGDQLTLTLWDVVTGNQIKQIQYPINGQNYHDLRPLKFSPDRKIVYARFREDLDNLQGGKPQCTEHMCAFDEATGQMLYENLNSGWGLQIGKKFIYLTKSNQLHVHDAATNQLRAVLTIDTKRKSLACHVSPEDDYVAQVRDAQPKDIRVVGTPGSTVDQTLTCDDNVSYMELNNTGSLLAAMTKKIITIWKPREGRCVAQITHTQDEGIHLDHFADNDRAVYTQAQNTIIGWDIENKKLLLKKEFPPVDKEMEKKGALCSRLHSFRVLDHGLLKTWRSNCGEQLHILYSKLGKELNLKELSALLVLEYEDQHNLPFSPAAVEIVQNSENSLLKRIYESRYNTVTAEAELESAARVSKMQDTFKKI